MKSKNVKANIKKKKNGFIGSIQSAIVRVYSYVRNSVLANNQDEDGNTKEDGTIKMQLGKNADFVARRFADKDIKYVITEMIDDGYSGGTKDRPNFIRMCEDIELGLVDVVVVSELSRLNRSTHDFLEFLKLCEDNGVELMLVDQEIDTRTPQGKMMLTVIASLAQCEREMTSVRVKNNVVKRLKDEGKINGASEVLGLVVDVDNSKKGHFKAHPEEIQTAIKIFNICLEEASKAKAVKVVTELGLTNRKGEAITERMIDYMILNARWRYRGLWYFNLENRFMNQEKLPEAERFKIINLPHGAVIDIDLLDRVVEKFKDTYETKKKSGVDDYIYLLSNLIFDEEGNPFKGESSLKKKENIRYRYYQNQATNYRIHAEKIHSLALQRVQEYLEKEEILRGILAEFGRKEQSNIPQIDGEIRKLKAQLENIEKTERKLKEKLLLDDGTDETFTTWFKEQVTTTQKSKMVVVAEIKYQEAIKAGVLDERRHEDIAVRVKALAMGFRKLSETSQKRHFEKIFHKIVIQSDNKVRFKINASKPIVLPPKGDVTLEDKSSDCKVNGGSEGTRTLGLLRDRQTL